MYFAAKHRNSVISKVRKKAAKSRFVNIRKLVLISRASRELASGPGSLTRQGLNREVDVLIVLLLFVLVKGRSAS